MEPVGRPVRRLIGAVTPDRSELLSAGGLPHLLAGEDVVAGQQDAAVIGDDTRGNGRRLPVHIAPEEAEDEERGEERAAKQDPEPAMPVGIAWGFDRHESMNLDEGALRIASARRNRMLFSR